MKAWFLKLYAWGHSQDVITWVGHGLMGLVLDLIAGPVFVAGAFVYREASDLLGWFANQGKKRPFSEAARDGFMDLWAPLAGAALGEILKHIL